jgi:hypothetical protein
MNVSVKLDDGLVLPGMTGVREVKKKMRCNKLGMNLYEYAQYLQALDY